MRAAWSREWTDRSASPTWGSRTVALVVTTGLFAAALAAMSALGTFPTLPVRSSTEQDRLVYVTPTPKIERPEPRPVAPRRTRPVEAAPTRPITEGVTPATGAQTGVASPNAPLDVHRDSSSTTSPAALRALFAPPAPPNALTEAPKIERRAATPRGAVGLPTAAGVTAPLTPGADTALTIDTYAAAIAEIQAEMAKQNRTHLIGGPKGTVGAGVSIPLPLLSSGPSPEERKRNEALDADYRLRLARLQALVKMQRDSARADSLRRDSLARRSIRP